MCWLTDLLARSKREQMKKEARNRSWGWMDTEKKIKGSYTGSDSQFYVCVSTLWCHRCYRLIHPLSATASCLRVPPSLFSAYVCVFLSSIVSVSSSLSKCQSKLLLFPDHAVGDRPTSSPWQLSVLAQRKRQGRRRKELLCLWTPTTFLIPPRPCAL